MARHVVAVGMDASRVAASLAAQLAAPDLKVVFVFSDFRLDSAVMARVLTRALRPAVVVGGTTGGVIAPGAPATAPCAAAMGLYGDWVRVGVGVAPQLTHAALTHSREAVITAVTALRRTVDDLDASRHAGITLFDSRSNQAEAFCIGSAATAPRARFVGGAVSAHAHRADQGRPTVWVDGHTLTDAGVVVMVESLLPIAALLSIHLVPTQIKTVVTGASGRMIDELDGMPAVPRLRALLAPLTSRGAAAVTAGAPTEWAFARYIDGVPYARSMTWLDDGRIHLASTVDVGQVLHVMRTGDLVGTTQRDLAATAARIGGEVSALLAFSCISRHWEADMRHLHAELAAAFAQYPTIGFQSAGEQSGMLLVNHTLTGLAIGTAP